MVDDGRGWCLTGWLSGHGARKFSKQSSAAPETQGRGFVVQTTQSVINLPMFVPLSIRGALCVTGCLSEQSDQGPASEILADIQIFSPNIKDAIVTSSHGN